MDRFVSGFGLGHIPHLPDESADLWDQFEVKFVSFWILVRADGTEERQAGAVPEDLIVDALVAG